MSAPTASHGVGKTCSSLVGGMARAGARVTLHTPRYDGPPLPGVAISTPFGGLVGRLPHRLIRRYSVPRLHRDFYQALEEGDIAYLWPSVPIGVYRSVHGLGVPIVMEAINTLMKDALPILDAAYDSLGLPHGHNITQARIDDEIERIALASAILSPSPYTDRSLATIAGDDRIVRTSYATSLADVRPRTPRRPDAPVTFLFLGRDVVRKGLHHLLEAWRVPPPGARLRVIGIEPSPMLRLYDDVLSRPDVFVSGFTRDPLAEYARSDVFVLPSLEEGDPLVTYDAAAAGIPILASAAGAGRIGADGSVVRIMDTTNVEALRDELHALAASRELREDWGARARRAVADYDWMSVAARRAEALATLLNR